jgi:DNA-3-methyladenine glycosylase
MLNVSSETVGVGSGVLVRTLEPLDGTASMQRIRDNQNLRGLARGPGRLATALDIDRRLDGIDLCRKGSLWLARDEHGAPEIGVSPRIGLSREADKRLRFYVQGNPFVSGPKKLNR